MQEILLVIVGMAIQKGLIEPIVANRTKMLVKQYLPILFDRLDPVMPSWIASKTPEELREAIFANLFELEPKLGEKQKNKIYQQLRKEYDPIYNCEKLKQ